MAFTLGRTIASLSSLGSVGQAWSVRGDDVDPETEMAPWFVSGMPRAEVKQIAHDMLRHGAPGNFLIRDVQSDRNCYGLVVKTPDHKLANFHIEIKKNQYRVRGTQISFPTLSELVRFYSESNRSQLGFQLIPTDPASLVQDYLPDLEENPNGHLSNSEDARFLSDKERWAKNARRESQQHYVSQGKSKNKPKNRHPRQKKQSKASWASSFASSPPYSSANGSHEPSFVMPWQQNMGGMPHYYNAMPGMMPPSGHGGGVYTPFGTNSFHGVPVIGNDPDSLRAAEAHLRMMKAESEFIRAQLEAAETTLSLYRDKPEMSAEYEAYKRQAEMYRQANAQLSATHGHSALMNPQSQQPIASGTLTSQNTNEHISKVNNNSRMPTQTASKTMETSAPVASKTSFQNQPVTPDRPHNPVASSAPNDIGHSEIVNITNTLQPTSTTQPKLKSTHSEPTASAQSGSDSQIGSNMTAYERRHKFKKQSAEPLSSFLPNPSDVKGVDTTQSNSSTAAKNSTPTVPERIDGFKESASPHCTTEIPRKLRPTTHLAKEPKDNEAQTALHLSKMNLGIKLDSRLATDVLKKFREMELREAERRAKFDAWYSAALEEVNRKPEAVRHRTMLDLDKKENAELQRRKEWERQRKEHERRALMEHPDAVRSLEEYLAEEEKKHEEEHLRQKQEEEERQRALQGRVKKVAEIFDHQKEKNDAKPKDHVMTWKVRDKLRYEVMEQE